MSRVRVVSHSDKGVHREEYKIPYVLMDKAFAQNEMSSLLTDDAVELNPLDYDLKKGGIKYAHGSISRHEAELRLARRGNDGCFLVRVGSNGSRVLSVK